MAGHINHVIDAAHDPKVTVLILAGAVTGKVHAFDLRPVLLPITRVVAIDGSQHRRPRTRNDEIPTLIGADRLAVARHHVRFNTRKWFRAGPRLGRGGTRQRRNHDRASFSLPPRVYD